MSNVLLDLSNALTAAAEKGGQSTVLVNARRRLPASGIAFAADLVLTADHALSGKKTSACCWPTAAKSLPAWPDATLALTWPC